MRKDTEKEKEGIAQLNELLAEKKEEHFLIKKLKRAYIIIIALLLAVLVMIGTGPGLNIFLLLTGRISSVDIAEDFTMRIDSRFNISISPETYVTLVKTYRENQANEFAACLIGKKQGSTYYVWDIIIPKTYNKDVFSVNYEMCPDTTIISLHSHPYMHCLFSGQDISSYERYKQSNQRAIMGLMCSEKRFAFYTY